MTNSGFLIFAFVFEIQPILFPYTLLWGVQATPNQHLLTLPSSPSSDLHAEVQQFKPHLGHKFFLHTYTHFCTLTRINMHAHTCACVCECVCVCMCMLIVHYASAHSLATIEGAPACTPVLDNFFYLVWQ